MKLMPGARIGYVGIGIIMLFIGLAGGFFIGRSKTATLKTNQNQITPNSLYSNQTAVIVGKIIKINGSTLTVENDKKISGNVELAEKVYINKVSPNPRVATPSTNLKDIEAGRDANLYLQMINGAYKVISITYPPPVNSISSPSSSLKSVPKP